MTEVFFRVNQIPAESSIIPATADEAKRVARGDLHLAFCSSCGFIFNQAFDQTIQDLAAKTEDSQGFSATFGAFARSLAQRWIDRYELVGKTILEIGCGRGEFLEMICKLAGAKGIGVDPRYRPPTQGHDPSAQLKFIRDVFDARLQSESFDFVFCRHTFEHIPQTLDFLQSVAEVLQDRPKVKVAFEIPDIIRVLDEGAFWDVYYEHCSYFSPGSEARIFRDCGFEIVDLRLEYAGQYLILEASPQRGTGRRFELEESVAQLAKKIESFSTIAPKIISDWRGFVDRHCDERVVVWGSGSKGVAFLSTLDVGNAIQYVVDINPGRHGRFMPGTAQQIVSPEFLREYKPGQVIVMNPVYKKEISDQLASLGLRCNVVTV